MNYQVVTRTKPYENGSLPSVQFHVREIDGSRTVCGQPCLEEDYWEMPDPDAHPEDVDAYDRCNRCYKVLEYRKRQERLNGGYSSLPSSYTGPLS